MPAQDVQKPASMRGLGWARGVTLVACVALGQLAGCIIDTDRPECDDALKVICSCASRPCDQANPPDIVRAMRRCSGDDVRPGEMNVHICINEQGAQFCRILDGLAFKNGTLCNVTCDWETACTDEIEAQCHDYQYNSCSIPETDGGTGDGG